MSYETAPVFDSAAFNDDFFAGLEAQMADIDIAEQASAALADILTVKQENGSEKTYEQIRDESKAFFSSEWVRQDEAVMNRMAAEFALACLGHSHGSELAGDGELGTVFTTGIEGLGYTAAGHAGHHHSELEDDETDGTKKKKRRRRG